MRVSRETGAPLGPLSPADRSRLEALAGWLAERAHPLGLTNFATPEEMLLQAVLPARVLFSLLPDPPRGCWADLGAGAGALGLTLATLAPSTHFDLVDRRRRVIVFLDLTIRHFGLPNASAVLADLATRPPSPPWDGVCLRAIAPAPEALALAAPHARRWICAWHGANTPGYDRPPPGFRLSHSVNAGIPTLCASLHERISGLDSVEKVVDTVG